MLSSRSPKPSFGLHECVYLLKMGLAIERDRVGDVINNGRDGPQIGIDCFQIFIV